MFALALSWAWTALGLTLRTPNAVLSVGLVILFPLVFMSNVFVDPATMPGWLRAFAHANPMSHLATAERELIQGAALAAEVVRVVAAAVVLTGIFAPLTTRL